MEDKVYKFFKYLKEEEKRDVPLSVRIKYNIDLYYEDKTLIKDEEVLTILDKAYEWLYDFLTDDLNNLETFKYGKDGYDFIYGYSKDNILLAYDEKNGSNDIHWYNFYLKFRSYMSDYITDHEALKSIIHEYLVNALQMKGTQTTSLEIPFF